MEPRPGKVQTCDGSTRQEYRDDQVSRVFRPGGATTVHGVHVQPRQEISGGGKTDFIFSTTKYGCKYYNMYDFLTWPNKGTKIP